MSLIIDVPYAEKDEAKSLGAKWNPKLKKWYVEERKNYYKFEKWILGNKENVYILCDYFYIVEGTHICFKCNKPTKVIGFGVKNFFEIYDSNEYDNEDNFCYYEDDIHIASHIEPLSQDLLDKLKEKHNYYKSYSKTVNDSYLANHCLNCKIIQGEFFLFGEIDTPFFIDSIEKAKQLKLYKVHLENDLIVNLDIGFGSEDYLIEKYAQKSDFYYRENITKL